MEIKSLEQLSDTFAALILEVKAGRSTRRQLLDAVDQFDWETWNNRTQKVLEREYRKILVDAAKRTARSLNISFEVEDPWVQRQLTEYIGERIKELDKTTRSEVKDLIQGVLEDEGALTTNTLGDLIRDTVRERFSGYEDWRADRIARTETAIAYNNGTVFACRQAGVAKVEVSDGDDDEECSAVDGTIQTLEWALANPTAHPNCTRAFSPVLEEDE